MTLASRTLPSSVRTSRSFTDPSENCLRAAGGNFGRGDFNQSDAESATRLCNARSIRINQYRGAFFTEQRCHVRLTHDKTDSRGFRLSRRVSVAGTRVLFSRIALRRLCFGPKIRRCKGWRQLRQHARCVLCPEGVRAWGEKRLTTSPYAKKHRITFRRSGRAMRRDGTRSRRTISCRSGFVS